MDPPTRPTHGKGDPSSPKTSPLTVAIGVDPAGSLYYLSIGSGANAGILAKIQSTTPPPPVGQAPSITRDPAGVSVPIGGSATFTVEASGTAPLTYQWQKNGVDIPGATAASFTIPNVTAVDLDASYRAWSEMDWAPSSVGPRS